MADKGNWWKVWQRPVISSFCFSESFFWHAETFLRFLQLQEPQISDKCQRSHFHFYSCTRWYRLLQLKTLKWEKHPQSQLCILRSHFRDRILAAGKHLVRKDGKVKITKSFKKKKIFSTFHNFQIEKYIFSSKNMFEYYSMIVFHLEKCKINT